jgi:hypothetical protein
MMEEHAACAPGERKSRHSESVKKNLVTRLNRIEGQIRGIKGMIEKEIRTAMMSLRKLRRRSLH